MSWERNTPPGIAFLADAEPDTEFTLTISVEDAINVLEDGLANGSMSDLKSAATNLFGLLVDAAPNRTPVDRLINQITVDRLTGIIGEAVHFLSSGHGITVEEGQRQLRSMLEGNEAGLYRHALRRDRASQAALGRAGSLAERWSLAGDPHGALLAEALGGEEAAEPSPGWGSARAASATIPKGGEKS